MTLALRLAFRELRRGGGRGWWLMLACLALGVGAIAAVGAVRAGVAAGLAADGRRILGGDIEVAAGAEPVPAEVADWLRARGATLSEVVRLRSLLVAPSGARALVELKAVDGAWPLVGAATLAPPQPLADALAPRDGRFGLLVEPAVLDRLGVAVGARLKLGEAEFDLRGVLVDEPDRVGSSGLFGPRVLISTAALAATGLIQPGSLDDHALRATLRAAPAGLAAELRARFAALGLRIRDAGDAAPELARFLDRIALFLALAGLTTLLMGGIGVANGVRAWIEARARSVAILRCLGASNRLIFAVSATEIAALALAGILAGLAIGAVAPFALAGVVRAALGVAMPGGIRFGPLLLAGLYGTLTAAAFALWPLARGLKIPGAALFRDDVLPAAVWPGARVAAATAGLGLALAGLTLAATADRRLALWFCLAVPGAFLLLRAGAVALMRLARLGRFAASPALRLGLANLYRPGAASPVILLSLGLGLSTLATVALIAANLRREITAEMPAHAPSLFFIDIQPDQRARFHAIIQAELPSGAVEEVPNLRARIVAIGGVPVSKITPRPDVAWVLRGDRGLTYAAAAPAKTRLVAGPWWPADYAGPPLLSFDADIAAGLGLHLGDSVTLSVLGRQIDFRVANLRAIDWSSLDLNFVMVASPAPLTHAPHSFIAALHAPPASEGRLLRAVTDALPNVTGIPLAEVLRSVAALLARIDAALLATGGLTLITGALVLAGAIAAGQRRRRQEAVILKTLGASQAQIIVAWLAEFGSLGLAAGVIAAVIGTGASYGVLRFILDVDFVFLPGALALPLFGAVGLILLLGASALAAALGGRPGPFLRND